jgi:hypothetical protein
VDTFWVARKIIRSLARASSTAFMELSRPTNSGRIMYGKMTVSRTGSIGRVSGIFICSSSMIFPILSSPAIHTMKGKGSNLPTIHYNT